MSNMNDDTIGAFALSARRGIIYYQQSRTSHEYVAVCRVIDNVIEALRQTYGPKVQFTSRHIERQHDLSILAKPNVDNGNRPAPLIIISRPCGMAGNRFLVDDKLCDYKDVVTALHARLECTHLAHTLRMMQTQYDEVMQNKWFAGPYR